MLYSESSNVAEMHIFNMFVAYSSVFSSGKCKGSLRVLCFRIFNQHNSVGSIFGVDWCKDAN